MRWLDKTLDSSTHSSFSRANMFQFRFWSRFFINISQPWSLPDQWWWHHMSPWPGPHCIISSGLHLHWWIIFYIWIMTLQHMVSVVSTTHTNQCFNIIWCSRGAFNNKFSHLNQWSSVPHIQSLKSDNFMISCCSNYFGYFAACQ